ncbi:MFS transporter [Mesobacillus subterraneus]|uniref:MFS transporter n=1 Tax=Mesobacillus subterraneus TaxID=285983 RepID=UPI00273D1ECD|nr:MFS transporter [Mesobacillus subterraneus]WLR54728.1 MFS transporter [Mesobacillus subterraneus]
MQKEKLWTKDFISISLVNFVMMLSMYLLIVTMASYATDTYGASTSMAGLASSIFIIGVLFARLYAGKEIARIGSRKMLIGGILFFVLITVLYLIPSNIYVLLIVRFLHGVGIGFAATATGTIVAQVVPASRKGEGISYFSLSVILSTAVGPLIGLGMIAEFGYQSMFIFSLVVGLVSLPIALRVNEPAVDDQGEGKGNKSSRFSLANYLEPNALPISIVMFVIALAYSGTLSFIASFAKEAELTDAGSMYFFVYAMAVLFSRPFTGKLMDAKGANSVVYPALMAFALGMYALSQAQSSAVFLLGAALIGLGYGNFQSVAQTIAIKMTPPHRMGMATSTFFIMMDIGIGFGPFLLGYMIPDFGYRGLYLAMVPLIIAGIFIYYSLHGKKRENEGYNMKTSPSIGEVLLFLLRK